MLKNNRAIENGGDLYFTEHSKAIFHHGSFIESIHNTANRYGGALYSEVNYKGLSKLKLYTTGISCIDNRALRGNFAYLDIPTSCDEACLRRSIVGVNQETLKHGPLVKHIHTPKKLVLHEPAVCIYDDNGTDCGTYFVKKYDAWSGNYH